LEKGRAARREIEIDLIRRRRDGTDETTCPGYRTLPDQGFSDVTPHREEKGDEKGRRRKRTERRG